MDHLSTAQRDSLLRQIEAIVAEKYYGPAFDNAVWQGIVARHRDSVITASNAMAFETAVSAMLRELSPRCLGFLSQDTPITPRNAINASFSAQQVNDGLRWVFQDVLPEGVAAQAGARSGDILLTSAGKDMRPESETTAEPPFEISHEIPLTVRRGTSDLSYSLRTGDPKYKKNPYSDLKALTASTLDGDTAYLRVSLFPGKIGIDFANELDRLFRGPLAQSKQLIVDLRGNPGGGIGGLTLMSYLTPDRLPIGFSKNRKIAEEGIDPATLPIFDKIPRSKLAIPFLALKFRNKKSTVFLHTEGLGRQAFSGRIVLLVNEHTTSTAEMVAQFAQENRLALIVGTKTPGRLAVCSTRKLTAGYKFTLPVAAFVSAKGQLIEGRGIEPDVSVPWSFADAVEGKDNQLTAAIKQMALVAS